MSSQNRKIRILHNNKQSKISTGTVAPLPKDGNDGDLTVRFLNNRGLYLFYKYKGTWYHSKLTPGYDVDFKKGRDPNVKYNTKGNMVASGSGLSVTSLSAALPINEGGTGQKNANLAAAALLNTGMFGNALTIGDSDDTITIAGALKVGTTAGTITTSASDHDAAGNSVSISGGDTTAGTTDNINGGNLILNAGRGKGSGSGGSIILKVADGGGSGSSLNSLVTALTIADDTNATLNADLSIGGDLTVNGNNINYSAGHSYISIDANSGTNQGGHRLILQSGQGTGSGTGGNIYFDVSAAGSSGSSTNARTSQVGIGSEFLALKATNKLLFDNVHGSGNTYIVESASDVLDVYVGGDKALSLDENTGYIDTHEDWTLRTGAPSHSSNRLKLLPSDFVASDGGRPVMIDDTGSDRWLESYGTLPMFACKEIPRGYKATVVRIEGSGTSSVTVYEATYTSKSVTSKGTGSIGSSIDITDVNSTDSNYLLIEMAQASGEEVYGGHIDISPIT